VTTTHTGSVLLGVAGRNLGGFRNDLPKMLLPMLVPLFFFAAFKGALSSIGDTRGFGYYDFTAFEFVFILYMEAMFVGMFTSFDIGSDYESGIGSRLMAGAPRRLAIIGGYLIAAVVRGALGIAIVWAVVLATGMPVQGGALDVAALVLMALLLNIATCLFGAGIALRLQTVAASALILIPVFMLLFMTPVFVPRDQLTDWLQTATGLNPLTASMEAGRGFLAGDPVSVGLGFAAAGGFVIVFAVWAVLGMRKAAQG
jgi:ABC-type multidrug transport system permease subunit